MLIHEVVEFAARRSPKQTALVFEPAGVDWSFAELQDRARRMAAILAERVEPGGRVAVLSHNTADYVTMYSAASRAGVVLVLLNQRLHPDEWAEQLDRTGATLVVGDPDLLADVEGADTTGWTELATDLERADPLDTTLAIDERDPAWIIFTSGTTGRPKGAVLTHRSLLAAVSNTAIGRPAAPDDVYVFPFPLCHVAAYNVLHHHLRARPVLLMERFDPEAVMGAFDTHRATTTSLAPTMIAALLDDPSLDTDRLSTLRSIGYGASSIPADVLRRGLEQLGCDFAQGYGMTELSGNAVFGGFEQHRRAAAGDERLLKAAGLPGPLVSIRLASDGEIELKGDQVFAGYWDDSGATADAFTEDGWFRTGDVGRIDSDGTLSVIDRKKDLVVSGGENISSREIEDVLHDHPAVAEAAVVGTPDDRWGEVVTAVVVVRPGHEVSADEFVEHCRSRLASFKKPRRVEIVDELPKNASGKILKRDIRDRLEAERIGGVAKQPPSSAVARAARRDEGAT